MEQQVLISKLKNAAKNAETPAELQELLVAAVDCISMQAEVIEYARTIQTENVELKAKLAKAEAQRDAAYADMRLIEQSKNHPMENRPCRVCKLISCYCSSGGSACKGFKWRGFAEGK